MPTGLVTKPFSRGLVMKLSALFSFGRCLFLVLCTLGCVSSYAALGGGGSSQQSEEGDSGNSFSPDGSSSFSPSNSTSTSPLTSNPLWWFGTPNPNPPSSIVSYEFAPLAELPGYVSSTYGWMQNFDFESCSSGFGTSAGFHTVVGPYGTVSMGMSVGC